MLNKENFEILSGNIDKFEIKGKKTTLDVSGVTVEFKYYESVLSNTISATATIVDTGFKVAGKTVVEYKGIVEELPLRGGEECTIILVDNQKTENKLTFTGNSKFYVNRVRDIDPGVQRDVFYIDFGTQELFANEQTRVVSRYDGKISDNVKKILEDRLKTKKDIKVDDTLQPYNFIGNDRKPLYVCTWLASKSVPATAGKIGGAAGYFFYETHDGFQFRSIDALFKEKQKKTYIYIDSADLPTGYDGKILSYTIDNDIDLQQNLTIGTYSNRSLFFDYYAYDYQVRNYQYDDNQKDKIENGGGDEITTVSDEFRLPISRLMNHVLDYGVLPSGKNAEAQLKKWKSKPENPNYDAANTMVQSIMRYNQMQLIKIDIVIGGDFSLRAGDRIKCDFVRLEGEKVNKNINDKSSGIYMIESLCHRVTPTDTFTSLTLVRDSFGRQ